jgi:hypothetical protein
MIKSLRTRLASSIRACGLFLCHAPNDRVMAHFERLRCETEGLVDWTFVPDNGHLDDPRGDAPFPHPGIVMPDRFATARKHGQVAGGAGMMDIAIMPRVLAAPRDFVWALEYDVDYSGHWADMFGRFAGNRADVLTTTLRRRADDDWWHWTTARAPAAVKAADWSRSFNPAMRLSRRFAAAYVAATRSQAWGGHYEFTIPTVARHLGLRIEDLAHAGAHGRRFETPLYHNTPAEETIAPGTFVWRPALPAYFHERPEGFPERNRLYHPVKPE